MTIADYMIARYLAHDKNSINLTVSNSVRLSFLGFVAATPADGAPNGRNWILPGDQATLD